MLEWDVEPLFGGSIRTNILGYLAQATAPRTGYVIAKDMHLSVSKVYPELKRLEGTNILRVTKDLNGRRNIWLADDDLRRFLQRHVRLINMRDMDSPETMRRLGAAEEAVRRMRIRVPKSRVKPGKRPFEREFYRPPEKDRAVKRLQEQLERERIAAGKTYSGLKSSAKKAAAPVARVGAKPSPAASASGPRTPRVRAGRLTRGRGRKATGRTAGR